MSGSEIERELVDIVSEQLGVEREGLTRESKFYSLGCDSLDHIEIALAIEEQFGIETDEAEMERIKTFGQLLDLVLWKKGVEA